MIDLAADPTSLDADLAMIVERWPTLPAGAKGAILAMIEAHE